MFFSTRIRLLCVALALFRAGGAAFAQTVPTWDLHETENYFSVINVDIESHLHVSPGSENQALNRYLQDKADFEKWYRDEKDRLSQEFNGSSGEARINSARGLFHLEVEAAQRWDAIQQPREGTWEGEFVMKVTSAYLGLEATSRATVRLTFTFTGSPVSASAVGELKDGVGNISLAFPPGAAFVAAQYDETWTGRLRGAASYGVAKLSLIYQRVSGEGAAVVGFRDYPLAIEVFELSNTHTHGTIYLAICSPDQGLPCVQDYDSTLPVSEMIVSYTSDGWGEEWTDDSCAAFGRYAQTVDAVRQADYSGMDPAGRMDLAWRTIDDFLGLAAEGEYAMLELGCIEGAGLASGDPGSLYDKWFKLWFDAGTAYWNDRVAAASGAARINALYERFQFLLKAINAVDLEIFSSALTQTLGLYRASPRLDAAYGDYYTAARAHWLSRLAAEPASLPAALGWAAGQKLVLTLELISESLAGTLGMTGSPSPTETAFENAAGGNP
ncbi:MAG: hypothetical protein JXD23_03700 [Spirochaetales bacterium]|nr:hypothetical protein [Spirochaetales bacterium]